MSFLVPCPDCGPRSAYEFEFGGEYRTRPQVTAPAEDWVRYLYLKNNADGEQTEWWYHRMGCRQWFLAVRNTVTNQVHSTFWPEQLRPGSDPPHPGTS